MTWIIIISAVVALIGVPLFLGRPRFWHTAQGHPDAAYDWFKKEDCWVVEDQAGVEPRFRLSRSEYVGPFRLQVPSLGDRWIKIYGEPDRIEESQNRFLSSLSGSQKSGPDHEGRGRPPAGSINLDELRTRYRGSRYADLIAHHLKRQSQEDRVDGIFGITEWLPSPLRSEMEAFIDRWNIRGHDKEFWNSDAADVMDEIMADARNLTQSHGIEPDGETLFNVFNIVTLSFAHSAYDQPMMRAFMGIHR